MLPVASSKSTVAKIKGTKKRTLTITSKFRTIVPPTQGKDTEGIHRRAKFESKSQLGFVGIAIPFA